MKRTRANGADSEPKCLQKCGKSENILRVEAGNVCLVDTSRLSDLAERYPRTLHRGLVLSKQSETLSRIQSEHSRPCGAT